MHTLDSNCDVGIIEQITLDVETCWTSSGHTCRPGYRTALVSSSFFGASGRGMENGNGAIWTDAACRQVHLEFWPHVAHEEPPRPSNQWALISDGNCTFAPLLDVPCFDYHAQDNGGVLNLLTVGLSQRDAARIAAGIRLDG